MSTERKIAQRKLTLLALANAFGDVGNTTLRRPFGRRNRGASHGQFCSNRLLRHTEPQHARMDTPAPRVMADFGAKPQVVLARLDLSRAALVRNH